MEFGGKKWVEDSMEGFSTYSLPTVLKDNLRMTSRIVTSQPPCILQSVGHRMRSPFSHPRGDGQSASPWHSLDRIDGEVPEDLLHLIRIDLGHDGFFAKIGPDLDLLVVVITVLQQVNGLIQ